MSHSSRSPEPVETSPPRETDVTDIVSTQETRDEARRLVVEAYAALDEVRRRWPEVRLLRAVSLREREENGFGPKVERMFRT